MVIFMLTILSDHYNMCVWAGMAATKKLFPDFGQADKETKAIIVRVDGGWTIAQCCDVYMQMDVTCCDNSI